MDTHSLMPEGIIWEMTYACPFRCEHCYSESGRRPSRQVPYRRMEQIVDAMLSSTPRPSVMFAGGEPLIVKGFIDLAARVHRTGAHMHLYTSGWRLDDELAERTADMFEGIAVSMDSPIATVNDRLRGRPGAFDTAIHALRLWNAVLERRRKQGVAKPTFGIECTVMRSNVAALERFCTDVVPALPQLDVITFGVVIPTGLASRPSFVDQELLTPAQIESMPRLREQIRAQLPDTVALHWRGVRSSLRLARAEVAQTFATVCPDGAVKVHPLYEGYVGHLPETPLSVLWQRTQAWRTQPSVARALGSIRSLDDWARVSRELDIRFASDIDRLRIQRRKPVRRLPTVQVAHGSRE